MHILGLLAALWKIKAGTYACLLSFCPRVVDNFELAKGLSLHYELWKLFGIFERVQLEEKELQRKEKMRDDLGRYSGSRIRTWGFCLGEDGWRKNSAFAGSIVPD